MVSAKADHNRQLAISREVPGPVRTVPAPAYLANELRNGKLPRVLRVCRRCACARGRRDWDASTRVELPATGAAYVG